MEQVKAQKPTIICNNAEISGQVKFGQGCIIHPGCIIQAEGGEIIFENFNIIEERVQIIFKANQEANQSKVMKIGSYNVFEIGSKIETSNIGDHNLFEHKCQVEQNCLISNACTIGSTVILPAKTKLNKQTKLYYPDKVVMDLNFDQESHTQNLIQVYETLYQLIPKHNPCKIYQQ